MEFPLSAANAARFVALDETDSTNDDLRSLAASEPLPEFTVIATTSQRAGRGRLGRTWAAPPGTSLAASVLLRPHDAQLERERYGWIPLLAGLAMTRTVRRLVPAREVGLKWPNDVLIEGRKVCGVLSELLPDGNSIAVGTGLNLTISEQELPVPTATSLLIADVANPDGALADRALAEYLGDLKELWGAFTSADAGKSVAELRAHVSDACSTLGREVRVDLPDGSALHGRALGIDDSGRLRIGIGSNGRSQTVAAGDVTHLRYE